MRQVKNSSFPSLIRPYTGHPTTLRQSPSCLPSGPNHCYRLFRWKVWLWLSRRPLRGHSERVCKGTRPDAGKAGPQAHVGWEAGCFGHLAFPSAYLRTSSTALLTLHGKCSSSCRSTAFPKFCSRDSSSCLRSILQGTCCIRAKRGSCAQSGVHGECGQDGQLVSGLAASAPVESTKWRTQNRQPRHPSLT